MNKKLLKSFFAVVLAVAGIFAISNFSNAGVKGDVNGDGNITAADVTAVYDVLLGNNSEFEANADVNGDGSVTASDVTFIYDILLGNTPAEFEHVYILGEVNGNSWNPAVGVEMERSENGNLYSVLVEFAGENDGYSYFSFTTRLANAESETGWDDIAPYRFGAVGESDFLVWGETLETPLSLTYENAQAFKIPAGKYILEVNLEDMTLTVYPTMPPEPTNVYILGQVNGNNWSAYNGVQMTTEDGVVYTAHVTTTGENNGYSYFSFTKALADPNSETPWVDIESQRFGAVSNGDFLVTSEMAGQPLPLTYEIPQAFQIPAGEYDLTVNLTEMTLVIAGEIVDPVVPQPENNWYLIGTNNGWSTSDMSYKFTQSTENANVYSIHVDNVSGDFWFKIANEDCYTAGDFWSGTIFGAATDGESALSGNLVLGAQGAFCIPSNYNCTYLDITIDVENLTYTITTDGQEPVIDPTAEYDYVYIAGTADGWSGNGGKLASVKEANDYYGFINATGEFKIQKNQGSWATNWGGSNGTLVAGGNNIAANGFVYVNANLNNMTYSVTEITSMGIIGDATAGGWDTETALTYNAENNTWEATDVVLTAGSIKFRANNGWDINFGGALDNLVNNGDNITVEAGTYKVVLTLVCPGEYTATLIPAN